MQNHRSISTGDEVAWVAPHSTFDGVHVPFLYQLTEQNQLLSLGAFECGLLCLQGCIIAAHFFCLGKQNNAPGVGITLLLFFFLKNHNILLEYYIITKGKLKLFEDKNTLWPESGEWQRTLSAHYFVSTQDSVFSTEWKHGYEKVWWAL